MKILLAVDGSKAALRMVDAVLARQCWYRDAPEYHLAYSHPPIPLRFATRHVSPELLTGYYREESAAVLGPAQMRFAALNLSCTAHGLVGEPAETLLHLANSLGADLMCVAPHDRSAIADAMLGSVAAKVARLSTIPVMFIR